MEVWELKLYFTHPPEENKIRWRQLDKGGAGICCGPLGSSGLLLLLLLPACDLWSSDFRHMAIVKQMMFLPSAWYTWYLVYAWYQV